MSYITGTPTLAEVDLYSSTTIAPSGIGLGDMVQGEPGGKFFRLVLTGASALVVGNLLQSSVVDTQFEDMTVPTAVASGTSADTGVVITNGTTTITAGQFNGAILEVSVTPGLGEEYTVLAHTTGISGAAITFYLDRPIRTAWTTSTKVTIRRSPYSGVIQNPTTPTGTVVGVANFAIPSASYGFIQTSGVASILSDATTFAVGSGLTNSVTVAGAVGVFVAGTTRTFIGSAMRASATGKTIPVDLKIF